MPTGIDTVEGNKKSRESMLEYAKTLLPERKRTFLSKVAWYSGHTVRYTQNEFFDVLVDMGVFLIDNKDVVSLGESLDGEKPVDLNGNHYNTQAEADEANKKIRANTEPRKDVSPKFLAGIKEMDERHLKEKKSPKDNEPMDETEPSKDNGKGE